MILTEIRRDLDAARRSADAALLEEQDYDAEARRWFGETSRLVLKAQELRLLLLAAEVAPNVSTRGIGRIRYCSSLSSATPFLATRPSSQRF